MSTAMDVVQLSRLQFGLTALYHFLFVPLTLGLSILLGIMESVYVLTGKEVWRQATKFWGVLFGINFAMGVATGITMEFQFGMNWAYYSHYVGDIFGAPLAIEGLMAFFLDSDRQWLDAASRRRPFQSGHDADGSHGFWCDHLQYRRAGKIRPHRERWLCHGRDVRRIGERDISAAWQTHRDRAAFVDGRGELRPRLRPLRGGARRLERIHGH
jgi:uncharacterized membrane protein